MDDAQKIRYLDKEEGVDNMGNDIIPDEAIDALKHVRNTGLTNMMDRDVVIKIALDDGFEEGAFWLNDHKKLYMDALNALGERLKNEL